MNLNEEFGMGLIDSFGRRITYLRLSVTDRCNLRCRYCMPAEGIPKLHHGEILSYEELLRISREAVALGIEKIRITGGEPLVRKGIVDFAGRLARTPGLRELVLTTNGLQLEDLAQPRKRESSGSISARCVPRPFPSSPGEGGCRKCSMGSRQRRRPGFRR